VRTEMMLDEDKREHIKYLVSKKPKLVRYDPSHNHRCLLHNGSSAGYFIADGVQPQYVCAYCWDAEVKLQFGN